MPMPDDDHFQRIEVENDELLTPREVRRELAGHMDRLTSGEIEKLVLIHRNQMIAVIIPFDRFLKLERLEKLAKDHDYEI